MYVINWFRTLNLFSNNVNKVNKVIVKSSTQKMQFSSHHLVKTTQFNTCGPLYTKLRKSHPILYWNSPSDGLDISIDYVDTCGEKNPKGMKTIVAIHGNPGGYTHFGGLIDHFAKSESRIRLIAPNLPDYGLTRKTMAFWHSNEERVQLIRDFLKAINVNEIDCLISHSAGIHPVSQLWSDPGDLKIKGVGIFCPQYAPQRFFTYIGYMSFLAKFRIFIALMDWLRPDIMARGRFPLAFANVDEFLYFLVVHADLKISDIHKRTDVLRAKQLPTLFVYGENDKLIKKEGFQRFYERIGANSKDVVVYGDNNSVEKESERQNWIRVLDIKPGGHFAYTKYTEEVAKHLTDHVLCSPNV